MYTRVRMLPLTRARAHAHALCAFMHIIGFQIEIYMRHCARTVCVSYPPRPCDLFRQINSRLSGQQLRCQKITFTFTASDPESLAARADGCKHMQAVRFPRSCAGHARAHKCTLICLGSLCVSCMTTNVFVTRATCVQRSFLHTPLLAIIGTASRDQKRVRTGPARTIEHRRVSIELPHHVSALYS